MPPAFVLSQDQTLRKINFILSENPIQAFLLVLFWLHRILDVSKWIFKVTSHYSIFNQLLLFLQRLIIYHSLFRLSSEFLKYFWDFLISVSFISSGPCGPQRCETLLNISSIFVLSNYFLKIFDFFIQPFRAAFRQLRCKTSLNISSNFVLSNAFLKIFDFLSTCPAPSAFSAHRAQNVT